MQVGASAVQREDFAAAKSALETALREAEAFGPRDARSVSTLVAFGEMYRAGKYYAEAAPLYQRALEIQKDGDDGAP